MMNSVSTQTRRWHHIGFITLFGAMISGLFLFVLWSSAFAAYRTGGAGNCGNFADAIQLAEDGDIIVQMVPSNNSGSPVITKNLRLSGGWLPTENCAENNQYFTDTSDYLAYGFQYAAPITRSELFPAGDSILTLEDPNAPGFPNLDKLIIEHFVLDGYFSGSRGISGIISGSAEVLLDNVWLQHNQASVNGGGISMTVRGGSHLIIEDSAFLTNEALEYGGGLYVELREGSYLTIENTLLNNNDALFGGGMHLVVNDTSRVFIKNSQFTANTTYSSNGWGGGGQIIMHGGQVTLDGVTFDGNFAGGDAGGRGGGLFIQMDAGEVIIKNSQFANNSAGNGGGLFVESVGNEPANVQIINTRFENNLPNPYQFLQTGSGALNTLILDQSVYLPTIQKPATPPRATARINQITLDDSFNYVVDYDTFNFTPALPGVHLHFFFDTVSPENAGMPGSGPWKIYGGASPYTGYSFDERPFGPYGAEKMCVLVANADHTVRLGTGNCVKLP